jgi:hypothetical protein
MANFTAVALCKDAVTLDADFEQCMTVVGRYLEWMPKMIKALHDLGHENGSSPYSWYARAKAAPAR